MIVGNQFKDICNNTAARFQAIVNALKLPRHVDQSQVKRLLSFIESVIDYYIAKDSQQDIRYPIVYIPCAKDWAEEVCIEYVAYKIESMFDKE